MPSHVGFVINQIITLIMVIEDWEHSQIARFARFFNNLDGLRVRILSLFNLFVNLGFFSNKLRNGLQKYIIRHNSSKSL